MPFFVLIFLMCLSANAEETILVIETAQNSARNSLIVKKARERGAKVIFYPGSLNVTGAKYSAGVMNTLKTAKFDTLIMSGHSGGGDYFGSKGELNANEIYAALASNPYAKAHCTSFLGLGCNTVCPDNAESLSQSLPKLKISYGYCGSADLGIRKEAIQYLTSYFDKRDGIFAKTNAEELKSYLDSFEGIKESNASIWLKCQGKTLIYTNDEISQESFLKEENAEDCEKALHKYIVEEKLPLQYGKYVRGEIELPLDTDKGELRKMYNIVNPNKSCFKKNGSDFEKLFNLLFFAGYRDNFATYFKAQNQALLDKLSVDKKTMQDNLLRQKQDMINAKKKCEKDLKKCLATIVAARNKPECSKYRFNPDSDDRNVFATFLLNMEKDPLSCKQALSIPTMYDENFLKESFLDPMKARLEQIDGLAWKLEKGMFDEVMSRSQSTMKKLVSPSKDGPASYKELLDFKDDVATLRDLYPNAPELDVVGTNVAKLTDRYTYPFAWHEATAIPKAPKGPHQTKEYVDGLSKMGSAGKPWFMNLFD